MSDIYWTDAPPVDGSTVITAARWVQLQNDITAQVNGNLNEANIADASITPTKLALGNQDVIQIVTVPLLNGVVDTSRLGFSQSSSSTKEFYGGTAATSQVLRRVEYSTDRVVTAACTIQPVKAGSAVASSSTLSVSASQAIVTLTLSSSAGISYSGGDRFGVNVTGSGGTTVVVGGFVTFYFHRSLA
jgi:hypothetical protein